MPTTTTSTPSVLRFLSSRSLASPKPTAPELADSMASAADSGKSGCEDKAAAAPDLETTVEDEGREENGDREPELDFETGLRRLVPEIDRFVESLASDGDCQIPPDVPDGFERFAVLVEEEIGKCDSGKEVWKWCKAESCDSPLLEAVGKVSRLGEVLARFQAESKYVALIDRATNVVQRAMAFLEEELRCLLEESKRAGESYPSEPVGQARNQQAPVGANQEVDRCVWQEPATAYPSYAPDTVAKLARIAAAMMSSGYEMECCQVYSIARRNA